MSSVQNITCSDLGNWGLALRVAWVGMASLQGMGSGGLSATYLCTKGTGPNRQLLISCIHNFQVRRLEPHWLWGATTGCSIGSSSTLHSTTHTRLVDPFNTHTLCGCGVSPTGVQCLHRGCPWLGLCNYGWPKPTQWDCAICTTFNLHVP